MVARKYFSILILFLIVVLCTGLVNIQTVHADGEPPTEPPAPTQVETEPPLEETPAPIESVAVPEEAPVTPIAEVPTQAPEGVSVSSIAEVLVQAPENTEVVILDESGDSVPLVSQEAAEIAEVTDPMWCPEGTLPGGVGCLSFGSIKDLIDNMDTNAGAYAQDGIIYFTYLIDPADESLIFTASSLGGNDYNNLNDFNLTLQGGWNGKNGTESTFSGQTDFGENTILIGTSDNPWAGNVVINDIEFNNVSSANAVTVYTTNGDITLSNIDVAEQTGGYHTVLLDSDSGDIVVGNKSTFDGNNSAGNSNQGFSANTTTGSITIAGTSKDPIIFSNAQGLNGTHYDGAILSAPTVTLGYVWAYGNDNNGIAVYRPALSNASFVTLNNARANNNGVNGFFISNASFAILNKVNSGLNGDSGVLITGTQSTITQISGGTFIGNGEYGIEIRSGKLFILGRNPFCSQNVEGCYNVKPSTDSTPPVITHNVSGIAGSNDWYTGDVSVSWSVSDPESSIFSSSDCETVNLTSDTAGVTLTCSATNGVNLSSSDSVTIKIDKTNPGIILVDRTAPNANGWNNSAVTLNWSCADSFSGPVLSNVSQVLNTEGAGQSATGTCTDNAGNVAFDIQSGINIDKTVPVLTLPSDVTVKATSVSGAVVNYAASALDNLDGSVSVNCLPASGSTFGVGTGIVNCSAIDAADNTTAGSFIVNVQPMDPVVNIPVSSSSASSNLIIPLTGGELLRLDCNSVFWAFGVKLSFINLCDHQTTFHNKTMNDLPAELPDGFSFVMGLDVSILNENRFLEELPNASGIEMDFPIYNQSRDEFAVLYWNDEDGKGEWIEISQQISMDEISEIMNTGAENEFYQLVPGSTNAFYPVLTTAKTGCFILVKK